MKKIFALVSFLLFAAACATEPTTNTNMSSNANTTTMKSTAPSEADMTAKEKAVWDTLKKKDLVAFGDALTSDYIEVEDDGVFDKAGITAQLKDLNLTEVTFSDWKMLPIDNDAVILTYKQTNVKGTFKGDEIPPGPYYSASLWVSRNGKWQALFYQQTLSKPSPPPPSASPAPTKPEKAAASPAAKPAETGPDPIANEKLVWDAIKSKNYDAFGAFLAPDSLELEADGVHDKSGSVKGVSMFDASKVTLSEWKGVKIDNDAALVTYLMTPPAAPNMGPERHTTIWASRSGKWMALLHIGTPVAKTPAKADAKPMKKM